MYHVNVSLLLLDQVPQHTFALDYVLQWFGEYVWQMFKKRMQLSSPIASKQFCRTDLLKISVGYGRLHKWMYEIS